MKRRQHVLALHGVSVEEYEAALERRCDWCSTPFTAARSDSHWCSWKCRRKAIALRPYGMTADDLRASLAAHGFRCAGCAAPIDMDDRHIDHDHETGALRGLLCPPCNLTIGVARENIERLLGLAQYLGR